jgi:hypothetical protein
MSICWVSKFFSRLNRGISVELEISASEKRRRTPLFAGILGGLAKSHGAKKPAKCGLKTLFAQLKTTA